MTLSTTTNRVSYAGDGATVSFSIPFLFLVNSHIEATLRSAAGVETTWTLGTQYSLTGEGLANGGTLTVDTSPTDYTPATGETLVIRRVVPETQETDYPEGGVFPSNAHEQALDKLTMMVQQQTEGSERAIKFSLTSPDSDVTFPDVTGNGSKVLRVKSDATGLEMVTVAEAGADLIFPGVSTDNAIPRFDGTGGTTLENSGVTIDDNDMLSAAGGLAFDKGVDIASASPLVIDTDGGFFDVTGTTGFSAMTVAAKRLFALQFDGALVMTHGASLNLPGGQNLTTAAGDVAVCYSTAANTVWVLSYVQAGAMNLQDRVLQRPVIRDYGETINAIGSIGGGTQDIDLTLGNVVSGTVDTSTTTFTFSNPPATGTAGSFTLILTNGGSQTVNWPASVDWAGASAPTLTSSGVDILTFTTLDGGTIWYGFAAGLDMS